MNKLTSTVSFLLLIVCLAACGQIQNNNNNQQIIFIDTSKLANPVVRAAFETWQQGDSKGWLSYFIQDAQLFDDGHTLLVHFGPMTSVLKVIGYWPGILFTIVVSSSHSDKPIKAVGDSQGLCLFLVPPYQDHRR